jgi:WD40 repeat protein
MHFVVQTARLWDVSTGETKMEFRGHDHVIECAIFVPVNAYPYIRELINDTVCFAGMMYSYVGALY